MINKKLKNSKKGIIALAVIIIIFETLAIIKYTYLGVGLRNIWLFPLVGIAGICVFFILSVLIDLIYDKYHNSKIKNAQSDIEAPSNKEKHK